MADQVLISLSKEDVAILKEVIGKSRRQRTNTASRSSSPDGEPKYGGPEVYIARIPNAGIPGLGLQVSGTGTGSTHPVDIGPANYADCDVWQINMAADLQNLESLVGFTLRVWNVCQSTVYGPQFVPIVKDKAGNWLVTSNGRDTEMLRVAGTLVGGWQPAYVRDYDVATGLWTDQDFVYIKESSGGEFDVDDIILDAHLVGYLSGYRRYLARLSGTYNCNRLGGIPLSSIAGYDGAAVQILGHDADGCLKWYTTATC